MANSDTRQELEAAVRKLAGQVQSATDDAKGATKYAVPALGLLGALVAYGWGRRRGRRRSASIRVERTK